MPIFEQDTAAGCWRPSPLAAGPFAGLQGGAVASLLTAEVELLAASAGWGAAISVAVWFLKPVPMARLRTEVATLRGGGRVSVVDNTLFADSDAEPCATARVTLIKERRVDTPEIADRRTRPLDPAAYPRRSIASFHGRPWMMDAMDAHAGEGVAWFRQNVPVLANVPTGTLSSILGPADWAHGISRPLQNVVADPNPNLTVHMLRPPENGWIGIRPHTWWDPQRGVGIGDGAILDVRGEIGSVSMAVALTPFPKPATAETARERA
jgi:hypothetical protein